MKHIKEYINESIEQSIYEGFLNTLKDIIDNVIDNPKKYFKKVTDNLEDLKKNCRIWICNYDKNTEKIANELDKLNNKESLKEIWKFTKKNLFDASIYCRGSFCGDDFVKHVIENFNCDQYKAIAIALISGVMAHEYYNNHPNSDYGSGGHHSSSSGSKASKAAAFTASAAAVAAIRRR